MAPLLAPAGLDVWQIAVALISGVAAKEIVISNLSILYGVADISSHTGMTGVISQLSQNGFSQLNAYALMVFSLLYIPCIASVATMKRNRQNKMGHLFNGAAADCCMGGCNGSISNRLYYF